MARQSEFFVMSRDRNSDAMATVTLNEDGLSYRIVARAGKARLVCDVYKDDGQFRGRQWLTTGAVGNGGSMLGPVGEGQHRTLRAAAQDLIEKAENYDKSLEAVRALGLA